MNIDRGELRLIVEDIMRSFFTLEEIRRLKMYASDRYYTVYIGMRDDILQTIDRAKEAKSLAEGARRIATEAYNTASNARSIASDAKTIANNAWSKAVEAKNLIEMQIYPKLRDVEGRLDKARQDIEDLDGFIAEHLNKWRQAQREIVDLYNEKKSKIETYNSEIRKLADEIGSPSKKGTLLYSLKQKIEELVAKMGQARVDITKMNGYRNFWDAGNSDGGLIGNLAIIMWDLGNVAIDIANMLEKYHIGFTILGKSYGWDFYVPSFRRVYAAGYYFKDAISYMPKLLERIEELGDLAEEIWSILSKISTKIGNILAYTQAIMKEISDFAVQAINILMHIGGSPEIRPFPIYVIDTREGVEPRKIAKPYTYGEMPPPPETVPDVARLEVKVDRAGRISEVRKEVRGEVRVGRPRATPHTERERSTIEEK